MGKARDLSNQRFGMLIATESTGRKTKEGSGGCFIWHCLCDCGKTTEVSLANLTTGHTRSCGCLKDAHPLAGTPTYQSWRKMQDRVRYEEYAEHHGDVSVCARWDYRQGGSFDNFVSDMGERPEGTSLNRINGAKVYSPETCEWATYSVQSFDQKRKKSNTSGRSGVRWREERQVWEARIAVNKEIKILYYGPSFDEACEAREEAELKYYGFIKE